MPRMFLKDKIVLFDERDAELVGANRWSISTNGVNFYVRSAAKKQYLHRMIMEPPADKQVDHINGNGLDNRRCNLRLCVQAQNVMNARKRLNARSVFKGISYQKRMTHRPWQAILRKDRKNIYLGCFPTELSAALAYDAAAVFHFGEFACLNFPENHPNRKLPKIG